MERNKARGVCEGEVYEKVYGVCVFIVGRLIAEIKERRRAVAA